MGLMMELQNKIKGSWALILLVSLFFYFSFFTIKGDRGFIRYMYLNKEIAQTQKIASQYNLNKQKLEDKVKLLSSSSLDLDLLEERARTVLNLAATDEFVILDN